MFNHHYLTIFAITNGRNVAIGLSVVLQNTSAEGAVHLLTNSWVCVSGKQRECVYQMWLEPAEIFLLKWFTGATSSLYQVQFILVNFWSPHFPSESSQQNTSFQLDLILTRMFSVSPYESCISTFWSLPGVRLPLPHRTVKISRASQDWWDSWCIVSTVVWPQCLTHWESLLQSSYRPPPQG